MKVSLAEYKPVLTGEWSKRNGNLMPDNVTYGSNRKGWWKGVCGHEWEASVKNRVNGAGCPYCAGRKCLPAFNDLASKRSGLIIEWSDKNLPLKPQDFMVNSNQKVWWTCFRCGHEWQARIADRAAGSGCPCCSGAILKPGINDLESLHPELMEDWSDENLDIDPGLISPLSRENVRWKCHECGYEWSGVIASRVRGQKCPLCAGYVLIKGYNDLATYEEELSEEWHRSKNKPVRPDGIHFRSGRMVWWKCHKCGHSWKARISDRVAGTGCPVCEEWKRKTEGKRQILGWTEERQLPCLTDDDKETGLTFDCWMPTLRTAVYFPRLHKDSKREKTRLRVMEILCARAGIRLLVFVDLESFLQEINVEEGDETDVKMAD